MRFLVLSLLLATPTFATGYDECPAPAPTSCVLPTTAVTTFWHNAFATGISADDKVCKKQCKLLATGYKKVAKANYKCGVAEATSLFGSAFALCYGGTPSLKVCHGLFDKALTINTLKSNTKTALSYCKEEATECAQCTGNY